MSTAGGSGTFFMQNSMGFKRRSHERIGIPKERRSQACSKGVVVHKRAREKR